MNNLYKSLLVGLFAASTTNVYAFKNIEYFNVAKDETGTVQVNKTLNKVKIVILDGDFNQIYGEEFDNVPTDLIGLFKVKVGTGTLIDIYDADGNLIGPSPFMNTLNPENYQYAFLSQDIKIDSGSDYINIATVNIYEEAKLDGRTEGEVLASQIKLTDGNILVGNADGEAEGRAVSGDVTMSNTGEVTINDEAVTLAKLAPGTTTGNIIKWDGSAWVEVSLDVELEGLQDQIDVLDGRVDDVETNVATLTTDLSDETAARIQADNDLDARIDDLEAGDDLKLNKDFSNFDNTDAPAARTALELGTIATQDADAVNISGGTIDGTLIGATNPSDAFFVNAIAENLQVSTDVNDIAANIAVNNPNSVDAALRVSTTSTTSDGLAAAFVNDGSGTAANLATANNGGEFNYNGTNTVSLSGDSYAAEMNGDLNVNGIGSFTNDTGEIALRATVNNINSNDAAVTIETFSQNADGLGLLVNNDFGQTTAALTTQNNAGEFTNHISGNSANLGTPNNAAEFIGNVEIDGDININSGTTNLLSTNINGDLSVTGTTTLSGDLNQTGDNTLTGDLSVTGTTTLSGDLNQTGDNTLTGDLSVTGTTTLSGDLNQTGDNTLTGDLSVTGTTTLNGDLNQTGDNTLTGDFDVTGTTTLNGDLNQTGDNTLTGDLSVTGTTTLSGDLNQTGDNTLTGDLSVTGTTTLNGNLNQTGNNTLTGDLSVTGITTLNGDLNQTGNNTLTGDFDVTGTTILNGDLNQIGNNTLTGDFDVTGTTTLNGDLNQTGNNTLTGDLEVTGTTTLNGDLNQTGNNTLTGDFDVTGTTTLNGDLNQTGNNTLTGDLEVTGITTLNGDLNQIGNNTLTGDLSVTNRYNSIYILFRNI